MTTGESMSSNVYGFLKHPSGLMLPKVLRDQLQQSLKENGGDNDSNDEEIKICRHQDQNRERYWSVTEIVDMINATSQKIENIQTQIINGEDYYVNNVTSISVYNTKNNYSDSTTFLDSKTESTNTNNYPSSSNTGGNATTNSYGMNNQHRWFSSSFTNIKPYQQTIPYPAILPRKENISSISFSSSIPDDTTSTIAAGLITSQSLDVQVESDIQTTIATSTDISTTTTTISKRGRTNVNAQSQPPPARRSNKRRRKT